MAVVVVVAVMVVVMTVAMAGDIGQREERRPLVRDHATSAS